MEQRVGRAWMALVDQCKRTYPWTCHLCGQPIPPGLHRTHPLAYQADHVYPVSTHPHLGMVLANLRPSHRQCNNYRKNRALTPALVAEITAKYAAHTTRPALGWFG